MKQLLFIIILISLYSCKGQEKNEKTIPITEKNTYKIPDNIGSNYDLDIISPYADIPIASIDSIKLCLRKLVCSKGEKLIADSIVRTGKFRDQYGRRVYIKLFPKENIIKGAYYVTKDGENLSQAGVVDLYYSSKKEAQQTFNDIKKIIEANKFDKECIEYFRPCGKYLLLNNNRITILEGGCENYEIIDKFIESNKNEFDEIIVIYDNYVNNKEIITYDLINKTK
ncbi:hypothetical protein HNQ02_003854 [Flavobacterium sp. 7E]|uniref:hypothetical protein n=1 Tax=Flavobacterium sp. 7E TaxID=2735898 RepID=UPI00156EAAC9|nr:hypothetical protein [Flavobacterium sp. 7E]NRS90903.1 hypothetical protein [Flavobacterium sp. 7E]